MLIKSFFRKKTTKIYLIIITILFIGISLLIFFYNYFQNKANNMYSYDILNQENYEYIEKIDNIINILNIIIIIIIIFSIIVLIVVLNNIIYDSKDINKLMHILGYNKFYIIYINLRNIFILIFLSMFISIIIYILLKISFL